jgi:hypothetical protein
MVIRHARRTNTSLSTNQRHAHAPEMAVRILAVLLLVMSARVSAASQGLAGNDNTFAFLNDLINSLARAHDAIDAVNQEDGSNIVRSLTALKTGVVELTIAQTVVKPHAMPGARFSEPANAFVTAFDWIRTSFSMTIAIWETVEKATSPDQLVGLRSRMSDAASMYQQSSEVFIQAANVAYMLSVDTNTDDRDHVVLSMSSSEARTLIATLKRRFGGKLATSNGDTPPMLAAKILLVALDRRDVRFAK